MVGSHGRTIANLHSHNSASEPTEELAQMQPLRLNKKMECCQGHRATIHSSTLLREVGDVETDVFHIGFVA